MKIQHLLTAFAGGELSPRLNGRTDVRKYASGCRVLQNAIVVPHGGARKRPGSRFVVAQKNATDRVRLVDYVYSTEDSYVLMFGPGYVWFFRNQGIVTHAATTITGITQANPAVVTSASHGYSNGDRVLVQSVAGMTELNNRHFVVANVATNTYELQGVNSSAYTAYASGGTASEIVELTTSYATDEIDDLQLASIRDVIYITHKNHALKKISRFSNTSWTLSTPDIDTGPFRTINGDDTLRITPSSFSTSATIWGTYATGTTCTLTASSAMFNADMVGALFRLNEDGLGDGIQNASLGDGTVSLANGQVYTNENNVYGVNNVTGLTTWQSVTRVPAHDSGTVRVYAQASASTYFDAGFLHSGYCVVRITAYTSTTVVTAEIIRYQMPLSIVSVGTVFWEEGAWSEHRGYPGAMTLFEQRLWLAGSESDPTVLWSSRSGGQYEDFTDGTDDNDAVVYRLAEGSGDRIRWISGARILTAGTSRGEYAVAASSQQEALTPSNMRATVQATYGTSTTQPIRINQSVLYPQRKGHATNYARKLREFAYSLSNDAYDSNNLTVFSEHITGTGFDQIAFAPEPDNVIWIKRIDGVMAGCTYEKTQEVLAWHRHIIGGTSAKVKSFAVMPGEDSDELWMSVERTINGATTRYIEVIDDGDGDDTTKEDAVFLDSAVIYDGASTTTVSGLHHLAGETVPVLGDGAKLGEIAVTNGGRITLPLACSKVVIGFPIETIIETEDLEGGTKAGTSQSRQKRISEIFVRLHNSLGGTYGISADDQSDMMYRTVADQMDASPALFSGLVRCEMPSGWEREAIIRLEHSDPFQFFVTGIVAELNATG